MIVMVLIHFGQQLDGKLHFSERRVRAQEAGTVFLALSKKKDTFIHTALKLLHIQMLSCNSVSIKVLFSSLLSPVSVDRMKRVLILDWVLSIIAQSVYYSLSGHEN